MLVLLQPSEELMNQKTKILIRSYAHHVKDDSLNYSMNLIDYLQYSSVYFRHIILQMDKKKTKFLPFGCCNLVIGNKFKKSNVR